MDGSDSALQKLLASLAESQARSRRTDFVDLCLVLFRRKYPFLIGVALGVAIALVVGLTTPRRYEAQAVIQIGQGADKAPLETAESAAERLKAHYGTSHTETAFLRDVEVNKHAKHMLTAVADGHDREQTENFLKEIVDKLLAQHEARKQTVLAANHRALEMLGRDIRRGESDVESIERRSHQAIREGRTVEVMALTIEKARLAERLAALEQKRLEMKMKFDEIDSNSTHVVRGPTTASPVGLNTSAYALLGALGGIVIGTIVALLFEFRDHLRKRQTSEAESA
jgi:uncharacterized protein involved in exopolysaccharide biosynthesis